MVSGALARSSAAVRPPLGGDDRGVPGGTTSGPGTSASVGQAVRLLDDAVEIERAVGPVGHRSPVLGPVVEEDAPPHAVEVLGELVRQRADVGSIVGIDRGEFVQVNEPDARRERVGKVVDFEDA